MDDPNDMVKQQLDGVKKRAKEVANKIWEQYKGKIIMAGVIALLAILLLAFIIGVIITFMGIEEENSKYNPMKSYGFWWPIGSQEVTTDEEGREYASGDPSAISITSDYKDRNEARPDHNGIDIGSTDTEGVYQGKGYHYIIATKAGTVITSHLSDTAGEYVAIDHGNGFVTKYMHMYENSRRVEVGDTVKQGQIIGIMGNTGSVRPIPTVDNPSAGTHLHFQIELYGEVVDPLQYVSAKHPRGGGQLDPFDTSISKDEFISCVSNYKKEDSNYQNNMVAYAEDFYDICTEKGVNPKLAFAHSCFETDYGSSEQVKTKKNYFGYAAYNSNTSAATNYETPRDSIEAYCDWVIDRSTPTSSGYQASVTRADLLSPYNSMLVGTPETNVYVLYILYAQLDDTHEGDYESVVIGDLSTVKYQGTYYFTYYMYGEMCNHLVGSPTTDQEKADYAVYTMNERIEIAQNIFGN